MNNSETKVEWIEELTQSEYEGFFSEFYDILHEGLGDVQAYVELGKQFGTKILELGSGTGRITIPLAEAGYKVTGLEFSQTMIDICQEKLKIKSTDVARSVELVKGDMTSFFINEKFNLIIAPCNVFNHLTSIDMIEGTLKCVKEHLADDGVFIIDNSMTDLKFMNETNGIEEVWEFTHPVRGTKIIDRFTAKYDFVNQMEYDHIILEEYEGEKLIRKAKANVTMTYFLPRELAIMLKNAGFDIVQQWGSLVKHHPVSSSSRQMIFLCKKF